MIITCSNSNSSRLPALGQTVNSLGKYLYKNLDGAIDFKKSANMFDVYTIVLYQIPYEFLKKYNITEEKYKEVYEMTLNINLTTYQSKIRCNIIEMSPEEVTLGSMTLNVEKFRKLDPQNYFYNIMMHITDYIYRRIEKYYEDYDFLY